VINITMDARNNIAQDLFYKIRSRFSGLKLGSETGEITINPEEARFFDFDYMEGETPIGHVSVSLAEPNSMKVYFSHGITETMDTLQKKNWYGFLKELRMFAKRRLLSFDTRDIAKDNLDKRDYVFLSQMAQPKQPTNDVVLKPVGESMMSESAMYGTKTVSYQKLENTRLIIKHNQALTDDTVPGARSRHISALFVENQEGERFKYPFIHLAGARAMQRHVANGGLPYDEIGKSIIGMSEEIAQLRSFGNYVVRNDLMNSANNGIVEKSTSYLNSLREQVKALAKQKNYEAYKETFQTQQPLEIPQDVVEQFTDQFTVKNFKEDIKSVFPVLYRLMQENNTVGYDDIVAMTTQEDIEENFDRDQTEKDPFDQFESWVVGLGEGSEDEEVRQILSTIADEEDWGAVYDLHKSLGQSGPEGIAAQIIDDMYSEIARETGAHADDDFESVYNGVLDRLIDEYGTEVEDPRAYADQSADADAVAYGQREDQNMDEAEYDPSYDPDYRPYQKPEQDPDAWKQERDLEEPAKSKTVSIVDDESGEVVDTFQSTGGFYGDLRKAAEMGYDTEAPESTFRLNWKTNESLINDQGKEKMNVQELAEFIQSFYDKDSGTFPKGPEGVCTMVGKKFGEQAEHVARKFVERMAPQQADASINELARIRELAGQQGSVEEASKASANFTADDLTALQKINDVEELRGRAIELISTPSERPMKADKVEWFKKAIASKKSKMDIIKLMYDLLLSGEGHGVVGSRNSMSANNYRQRFSDDIQTEESGSYVWQEVGDDQDQKHLTRLANEIVAAYKRGTKSPASDQEVLSVIDQVIRKSAPEWGTKSYNWAVRTFLEKFPLDGVEPEEDENGNPIEDPALDYEGQIWDKIRWLGQTTRDAMKGDTSMYGYKAQGQSKEVDRIKSLAGL
jgi:hypothetical protein